MRRLMLLSACLGMYLSACILNPRDLDPPAPEPYVVKPDRGATMRQQWLRECRGELWARERCYAEKDRTWRKATNQ